MMHAGVKVGVESQSIVARTLCLFIFAAHKVRQFRGFVLKLTNFRTIDLNKNYKYIYTKFA